MPYYKKELYLEQSIKSILNQTYQNFEIILINDDSENKNFISKFSRLDNRIRLVHNENNLGAGLSRNRGLELSNGEYIAFCDCDDLWKNNKIEFQIELMNGEYGDTFLSKKPGKFILLINARNQHSFHSVEMMICGLLLVRICRVKGMGHRA